MTHKQMEPARLIEQQDFDYGDGGDTEQPDLTKAAHTRLLQAQSRLQAAYLESRDLEAVISPPASEDLLTRPRQAYQKFHHSTHRLPSLKSPSTSRHISNHGPLLVGSALQKIPAEKSPDHVVQHPPQIWARMGMWEQDHRWQSPSAFQSVNQSSINNPSRSETLASQTTNCSLGTIPDFPLPIQGLELERSHGSGLVAGSFLSLYDAQGYSTSGTEKTSPRSSANTYASSNVIPSGMMDVDIDIASPDSKNTRSRCHDDILRTSCLARGISNGGQHRQMLPATRHCADSASSNSGQLQSPEIPPKSSIATTAVHISGIESGGMSDSPSALNDSTSKSHFYFDELGDYFDASEKMTHNKTQQSQQSRWPDLPDRPGRFEAKEMGRKKTQAQDVRDSTTSLPDLIRRATQLASNLDRGRTASRLVPDWSLGKAGVDNSMDRHRLMRRTMTQISPSDWLSGSNERPRRESTKVMFQANDPTRYPTTDQSPRRYWGMSRYTFCVVVLFLIVLIATAITIPVGILVAHRAKQQIPAPARCERDLVCRHNGKSVLMGNGNCGCVCSNGFQGQDCSMASNEECTTIPVAGMDNATIGTEVAVLIRTTHEFKVQLNGEALVTEFGQVNSTCVIENELVLLKEAANVPNIQKRYQPATTNGVVVASLTSSPSSSAVTLVPSGTVSLPSAEPSASIPLVNATTRTFASIGILFVLQDSKDLEVAIAAQSSLQQFISTVLMDSANPDTVQHISLGAGYYIDLRHWILTSKDGTRHGV